MIKHSLRRERTIRRISGRILESGRASIRVLKTNRFVYALIYDADRHLVSSLSTMVKGAAGVNAKKNEENFSFKNIECVEKLAEEVVAKCKEKNMSEMAFDRGGYLYHGVIKAFAEKLREHGIIV